MTISDPGEPAPLDWFDIARKWAELPAEHLKIAAQAAERQMARDHEYRMELARLTAQQKADERAHQLYLVGLIAGFLIAAGMLTGAVLIGARQPWLASMLAGPSVLALVTLFVLRKTDAQQTRAVSQAHAATAKPPVAP